MYIVSTTFVVEPKVHAQWYGIFADKFVATLPKSDVVLTRVMSEQSTGQYTYSLQVRARDIAAYQHFVEVVLAEFIEISRGMFADDVLHFTTLLKRIEI